MLNGNKLMLGDSTGSSSGNKGKNTETPFNGDGSGSSNVFGIEKVKTPRDASPTCGEEYERFFGMNFRTWQRSLYLHLSVLGLASFVYQDPPVFDHDDIEPDNDAWWNRDFLCRNHILNALTDTLRSVYQVKRTAKEMWESLELKYRTVNVKDKRSLVSQFLNYTMVDSKMVKSQVQELQFMFFGIRAEGMVTDESFQVAAVIDKLPPAWNDYKCYLNHKRKDFTMEELVFRLYEEELRRDNMRKVLKFGVSKRKSKKLQFGSRLSPKSSISKKTNDLGTCYAEAVEAITEDLSDIDLSA